MPDPSLPNTAIPQVTYDSNGYAQMLAPVDYGTNPWSGMVASQNGNVQTANAAQAMLPGIGQQMAGDTQNMNNYAQSTAPYPAQPNAYGLGAPLAQPTTQGTDQGITSRGMTPWSLQGEALSR